MSLVADRWRCVWLIVANRDRACCRRRDYHWRSAYVLIAVRHAAAGLGDL